MKNERKKNCKSRLFKSILSNTSTKRRLDLEMNNSKVATEMEEIEITASEKKSSL